MLELKAIKINKSMSEETLCFSAAIYLDGVNVGTVMNRGHGGPNEYHLGVVKPGMDGKEAGELARAIEVQLDEAAKEWAADREPEKMEVNGETHVFEWDTDRVVDEMLADFELRKIAQRMLKKGANAVIAVRTTPWADDIIGFPPGDADFAEAAKGNEYRVLANGGKVTV